MYNQEMKQKIKKAGLYQYEVADALGVTEMTLIRWMRKPLPSDKIERINAAIERLIKERENRG